MAPRPRPSLALPTAVRHAATKHGEVPIHLDHPLDLFPEAGTELDYTVFAGLVDRAARMLLGAGITPGNRVMVLKRPGLDIPLLAFACARVGAVPVLIHHSVGRENLPALVARAEPVAIVTDTDAESVTALVDVPADAPPRWYVAESGRAEGGGRLRDLTGPELPPPPRLDRGTPQLVTHTSGTTGVPKLVLQTAETFTGQCLPQAVIGRLLRVRDPYLVCISPVHVRTMAAIVSSMSLGVRLGFMTGPDPDNAARMLERVRPGVVEAVPNVLIRWEEIATERPELLRPVRLYLSTFDASHPRTIDTLLAAGKPGGRYIQVYGQSETGPVAMKFYRGKRRRLALPGRRCDDSRCVGRPIPGQTKVRITAEGESSAAARGVPGAILVKSAATTPSYLGTADQRVDGWWAMGDFGVVSERGCLHLYDRIIDRKEGVNSLLALEDLILERLPQLTEAALIPVTDGPPVPMVCTRRDSPLDHQAWRAAVADLPDLAVPVQCTWDEIPHTATWKVKRPEAARWLAARRAAGGEPGGASARTAQAPVRGKG